MLLYRAINYLKTTIRPVHLLIRSFSTEKHFSQSEDNPIKYTASPASSWKAQYSRIGPPNERLWYEPAVIILSITIFMIYFTILREENDIDMELEKSLYSRIDGLEEYQLKNLLQYNQDRGLDTIEIIKRLKEIEVSKS